MHFCKGFFVDSLPTCHPETIAVLRLDGDMYESTMDQLFNLYPRISLNGFIVVDDWTIDACRRAMNDFWSWHGITPNITVIDESSMFYRKSQDASPLQLERYRRLSQRAS